MALQVCASCRARVEDGAVRCSSCGTDLFRPGSFMQCVGWIVIAVALIPLAISEVTTAERNLVPLIVGIALFIAGIVTVVAGRTRSKSVPPRVLDDVAPSAAP